MNGNNAVKRKKKHFQNINLYLVLKAPLRQKKTISSPVSIQLKFGETNVAIALQVFICVTALT